MESDRRFARMRVPVERVAEVRALLKRSPTGTPTPTEQSLIEIAVNDVKRQVIDAAHYPAPMCRDCADNDGTCEHTGLPCDPFERALLRLRQDSARIVAERSAWAAKEGGPR